QLRLAFAAEELHVLDHEQVALAPVAALEVGGPVGADRAEQLVGELLAGRVDDARGGAGARLARPGGGGGALSEARPRDERERADRELAAVGERETRFASERVRAADDEAREAEIR